jgi:type I restriction enzyme, S subunit
MKIGDICEVVRGSSPRPRDDSRYYDGPVPRLMIADVTRDGKYVSAKIDSLTELGAKQSRPMSRGEVVIAVSGAPGLPAVLAHDACIHDGFAGLRKLDTTQVNIDFLYRYLIFVRLQSSGRAVGAIFKNLTTEQIRETIIPDFPIAQQKHIAAILDQAEALRSLRRQSIGQLDALARSVFLEMFGDPATNPKGWEIVTIRDLLESASYGTSEKSGTEGAFPVLRMNNLTYSGEMNFTDLKFMDLKPTEEERYLVRQGDVLFNRTNSAELVGKTAIYRSSEKMAYAGYLVRLRVNQSNHPEFISNFLNSSYAKRMLRGMCKSIIGMANINANEVQNMRISKPPLALQQEFADRIQAIEALKAQHRESLAKMDTLFNSLQHRAFRGEL